jgi:hypothetical protein
MAVFLLLLSILVLPHSLSAFQKLSLNFLSYKFKKIQLILVSHIIFNAVYNNHSVCYQFMPLGPVICAQFNSHITFQPTTLCFLRLIYLELRSPIPFFILVISMLNTAPWVSCVIVCSSLSSQVPNLPPVPFGIVGSTYHIQSLTALLLWLQWTTFYFRFSVFTPSHQQTSLCLQ